LEHPLGRWWPLMEELLPAAASARRGSRAYRMAARGSPMPASRWQARFPHEARGLHRNWLRTYTRWIVVGPAHRRFSVYVPRRDHWHVLFAPKKWQTAKGAEVFFFSFENFGELKLIFKKPLISRGTGGLHKGEDLSPSWIVLQVKYLKTK
jgi:hypothetical protein